MYPVAGVFVVAGMLLILLSEVCPCLYQKLYTYKLGLKSQLPHKTVNFIFQLVIVINRLTIWWGA